MFYMLVLADIAMEFVGILLINNVFNESFILWNGLWMMFSI